MKTLNKTAIKYFTFALLLILSISACSEQTKLSQELATFMNQTIAFPKHFLKVESGKVELSRVDLDKQILVLYSDALSCNLCLINHLHEKIPIYELADSLKTFTAMTILSPKEEEFEEIITGLLDRNFNYPVYIDTGDFSYLNTCIPEDHRFHSFLINQEKKPIFVGDPISSINLWDLFCKVVDNNDSTTNVIKSISDTPLLRCKNLH